MILTLTCAGAAGAAGPDGEDPEPGTTPEETAVPAGPTAPAETTVPAERITVTAPRPAFETEMLERRDLESGRAVNLAIAFAGLPGIWGVRRAQDSLEPVIRGLGWERVQTQVNGLPLFGACAARMDPPATLVSPEAARVAAVVKGLASVTLGPGGTGGRLVVSTDYERADAATSELRPWARLSYDDSRDGLSGGAGLRGGSGRVDFSAGLQALRDDDYTSAGGVTVPAAQSESSAFASIAFRPGPTQRLALGVLARDSDGTDFPSLPMDSDRDRDRLYTVSWRHAPAAGAGRLAEFEAHAGYVPIDHWMSNRRKSTWTTMESESRSWSDTRSAGLRATWAVPAGSLITGADFTGVDRDALRTRRMPMTGMTAIDHLWPDVTQDVAGLFVEHASAPADGWRVRLGLRYDGVDSAAARADDAALGGLTAREAYTLFYGPEAAQTDRSERLVSGNVLIGRELTTRLSIEGGIGVASRAAGVSERFFAYAPAPGGYLVGNPSLDAERKREASAGLVFSGDKVSAGVTLYRFDFRDYINGLVLARQDVNGDGVIDIVRGFENIHAVLTGGEAVFVVRPWARLSLPLSVAWVHATNRDRDTPLPEIPPLEARLAARFGAGGPGAAHLEIGTRLAALQDRIDPEYGESATPGYAVWHLRGEWTAARRLRILVGIENLFDKDYHEHLTREAAVPAGDLAAGDEIPQPGRTLVVSIRGDF